MAHTSNWNKDARYKLTTVRGPQNPYKIFCFDDGVDYWAEHKKPQDKYVIRNTQYLVAIFTVKYYVK